MSQDLQSQLAHLELPVPPASTASLNPQEVGAGVLYKHSLGRCRCIVYTVIAVPVSEDAQEMVPRSPATTIPGFEDTQAGFYL